MTPTLSFLRRYVRDARFGMYPRTDDQVTLRLYTLEAESFALSLATASEMLAFLDEQQYHRADTLADLRAYAARTGLLLEEVA